jgi:hypothetical protein
MVPAPAPRGRRGQPFRCQFLRTGVSTGPVCRNPNPQSKLRPPFLCVGICLLFFPPGNNAMAQTPEPVPRMDGALPEFSAAHPKKFSLPWRMGQAWLGEETKGFQAGTVSMAWQKDKMFFWALLPDREVFSSSTEDGQSLWSLGDVFEIFIRREESQKYLELHVSPNGHQLHLRWSVEGFQRMREGKARLQDFQGGSRDFAAQVFTLSRPAGWGVLVQMPAGILPGGGPFQKGDKLSVSFSRYDAGAGGQPAILSSTSPHAKPSYHRWQEWRAVVLD